MQNLTKVFTKLRQMGMFARQNWKCCSGCGTAALPTGTTSYCFYHTQDAETLRERGSTYLTFGIQDGKDKDIKQLGHLIVGELMDAGLTVEWKGNIITRIKVTI